MSASCVGFCLRLYWRSALLLVSVGYRKSEKMDFIFKQVTKLSGNANNDLNAGVTYWNLNNASANDNINIGSQLSLF